jgi:hypothetical protein
MVYAQYRALTWALAPLDWLFYSYTTGSNPLLLGLCYFWVSVVPHSHSGCYAKGLNVEHRKAKERRRKGPVDQGIENSWVSRHEMAA